MMRTRAQLENALYGKPGDLAVRADWVAHNCRVLAEFASVYREAADAVHPACRLGLQHMNSDAERYSCEYGGGTPRPILEAMRGTAAPLVDYRPGYAFYNERRPLDMLRKAYDIMVSTTEAAKFGFVDRMCHEAENWPQMAVEKNPNTQIVENALALAAGCNSLALYWGSDHYGEDDVCWSHYFDCVARWKPFFAIETIASTGFAAASLAGARNAIPSFCLPDVGSRLQIPKFYKTLEAVRRGFGICSIMPTMKNTLKPTLWRTCRVLMNPTRLRFFRIALEHDGELCVRDCARCMGLTDSVASIYLRQPCKGRLRKSEIQASKAFHAVNGYALRRRYPPRMYSFEGGPQGRARFLNRKSPRLYRTKFADSSCGELNHYGMYWLKWADVRRRQEKLV